MAPKLRVKSGGEGGHPIMAWPRSKTGNVQVHEVDTLGDRLAVGDAGRRSTRPARLYSRRMRSM